jgi:hypothetical protein
LEGQDSSKRKPANEWVHDLSNKMAILQMKSKKVATLSASHEWAGEAARVHELVNESIELLKALRLEVKALMEKSQS